MSLTITPLDAPLGAVVDGWSFREPTDEARQAILDAVDEHLVVIFRNGADVPTNQQVVDFCTTIGPLRPTLADRSRLPDFPAINLVSNLDVNGVAGTGGTGLIDWHSDLHFEPPLIEYLYLDALTVPPSGGDTRWTNLCAAYDALDEATRSQIDDLAVRYCLRTDLDFDGYFRASDALDRTTSTVVSLVQRNPRTGRKGLWANNGPGLFAAQVVGMEPAESDELLGRLYEHATDDRFTYAHQWAAGDACLWLNTQTMHLRDPFPENAERVLRHLNILGVTDPHQLELA